MLFMHSELVIQKQEEKSARDDSKDELVEDESDVDG